MSDPAPPPSDAPPAGRPFDAGRAASAFVPLQPARLDPAEGARRTALVRTTQPDLARRAMLERSRHRLLIAAGGFALLFGAVAGKLADATLLDPALPRRAAAIAHPASAAPAEAVVSRAPITDRNGEILAVSLPITALYANPRQIENPRETAERLIRVLPQLDRARVIQRLSGERQFAYLARALTPREQQAVNNLGLPGLYFEETERRYMPQGRAAVHVLGNVDVDGEGVSGIERWFDERLRLRPTEPLRLSLDIRVQLALRDAVQQAITDFNGIGGAGVLLDANTAEVLAMVSLPDYDAGDIGAATPEQRFNRVTVGVYEPGSTFKLFTAAMALENGTVNLWGGYDASRPITYGRFTINDYRGKGRWLALPEILAYSSNLAAARMAQAVGPARHREFMGRVGMLARQSIELPETALPLAPSQHNWREINTLTIGFGHGISVTPLHVVTGVAALANGGILRRPTLLALPPGIEREGTRVISERNSDLMRRLMRLVVTEGSGRSAEVPGYFVGGKTGTAQKTGPRGGYLTDRRIAAFVGAFPMQAPRYALYVMVDEPRPNARSHGFATAGWVAAPAAHTVVSRVAPILGLIPDDPRNPEILRAVTVALQPRRGEPPGAPPPPRPATPGPTATPRAPEPAPARGGAAPAPAPRPATMQPTAPVAPGALPPPVPLRTQAGPEPTLAAR